MRDKLQVGIVLGSEEIESWKVLLIEKIMNQQIAECRVFIHKKSAIQDRKFRKSRNHLWQIHMQIDEKYFKPYPNAFLTKNIKFTTNKLLIASIDSELPENQIDVLIWLSSTVPPENFYNDLPFGIWSFRHGAHREKTEHYLGYEEFMNMDGAISSSLIAKSNAEKPGYLLSQTWSMMPSLSISRSRNEHMWKLSSFVSRAIHSLNDKREDFFKGKSEFQSYKSQALKPISEISALINLGKHFCRMAHKALRKLFYREQWILMINPSKNPSTAFKDFKKILPPKDKFWADPFLIKRNGKHYLFFEELLYSTDRGHLSVLEIDDNGDIGPVQRILEKPYHLSYPFIFEIEGRFYMIPESYENRAIELYECTEFPVQWEHKINMMEDIEAFDSTLFFHQEKWWLFTVIAENKGGGHNDELYLFFADSPFTKDWKEHPQNPIVSDVRQARPGGRIFIHEGKIIRPSQDCSRKYGYGFRWNEIVALTETEYREKTILHVKPDWEKQIKRTHSYAFEEGMTVIDAMIQRFRYF